MKAANDQPQEHRTALLLYIASDVRSGSTLLDLILGSHPEIASVGEIQFLSDHFNRTGTGYSWDWKCTCGEYFNDCPFWSNVNHEIEKNTGRPIQLYETWVKRAGQPFYLILLPNYWLRIHQNSISAIQKGLEVADICWKIVDAIKKTTGKQIIVDSSKIPEQLRYMWFWRPQNIRMIYLVRDGRGVVYSKMTRAGDSARKASKNWVLENLKIMALKAMIPKKQSIMIKYENLCANPEKEIGRICRFLQIPPMNGQLSKSDRHNVGGSPHRFDWANAEIQLDQRWKTKLSARDRRIFTVIGGWLNLALGYR